MSAVVVILDTCSTDTLLIRVTYNADPAMQKGEIKSKRGFFFYQTAGMRNQNQPPHQSSAINEFVSTSGVNHAKGTE